MNTYLLIIIADFLLAANFAIQKKYQENVGASVKSSLIFNTATGCFSVFLFLIINGFRIHVTPYSLLLAAIFSTALVAYLFIGFRIMEKGNMSLYTISLMTGGMTVPYLWGIFFLKEKITLFRILGILIVIAAVVLFHSGTKMIGKNQLLLCIAVFFLNGVSSVTSKMHQISAAGAEVSSPEFAFWVMFFKAAFCGLAMLLLRKKLFPSLKKGDDSKKSYSFEKPYSAEKSDFSTERPSSGHLEARDCEKTNGMKVNARKVLPLLLASSIADGISYMLQLIGAAHLPATVLYPFITGGVVVLTSLTGVVLFHEKLSKRQLAGVLACFIGTLLFL